jgi:FAD/FMN-containing dehydrogenase
VFAGDAIEERYRTDILRKYRADPGVVVRPSNTAEVAAIVHAARQTGVPITALGGGTGLVGGGMAAAGGILLSFERMNRLVELDTMAMTMTIEAGATIGAAQDAAEAEGLFLPIDLGARGTATIGGAISTNAGGIRVLRWGMMRDMVLGLEAVLADGSVVSSLGKSIKDNAGYNWKHLLIGAEGTLGIVTRAVLRLRVKPVSAQTALIGLRNVEDAAVLLRRLQGELPDLSSFEVMWRNFYDFVSTAQLIKRPRPMSCDHGFYVIVETLGADPARDAAAFEAALERHLEEGLIEDVVIAKSERERSNLWAVREDLIDVMATIKPRYAFDVSMALSDMARFVADSEARLRGVFPDAQIMFYGHAGDGNLHVTVGPGQGSGSVERAINEAVYDAVRAVNGSISAEHGIGHAKRAFIGWTRSPEELVLMRLIKTALDPQNILNPGKVVPDAESTRA